MSVDIDRIEQMFEYVSMSPALTLAAEHTYRREQLDALRRQIQALETPAVDRPSYPVLPGLETLLPHGGLSRGAIYDVSSHQTLLWLLLSELTQAGHFAAVVGLAHLGLRSAKHLGVDLDKLVLLPQPGSTWWSATNTLTDALSVVVLRPGAILPSAQQRDRFAARLRERGSTLLVCGSWPGAQGLFAVEKAQWEGLGQGSGMLQRQILHCRYQDRRENTARTVRVSISADGVEATPLTSRKVPTPLRAIRQNTPELTRQAG